MSNNHPNATMAGGSTGVGVLVVYLLGNVFHVSISAELGAAISGTTATALLFIGRNGLLGLWKSIWHGKGV